MISAVCATYLGKFLHCSMPALVAWTSISEPSRRRMRAQYVFSCQSSMRSVRIWKSTFCFCLNGLTGVGGGTPAASAGPGAALGASGFIAAGAAAFGAGASMANATPALCARSESRDRIGFPLTPAPCARSAIPWSFETAAQQEIFDHSARLTHGFHGKRNYSAHVHTFGIGGDTELVNGLRSTPAHCARSVIKAQLCVARLEA